MIFRNTSWLVLEKFSKAGLGLFVSFLLADYLGVESWGLYNYLISVVSIISALTLFPNDKVVMKYLLESGCDNKRMYYDSLFVRFVLSTLFLLICFVVYSFQPVDGHLKYLYVLVVMYFLFKNAEILRVYFEAHGYIRHVSILYVFINVVFSILKVGCVVIEVDEYIIYTVLTIEVFAMALSLFVLFYIRRYRPNHSFMIMRVSVFWGYIKQSFPLVIASGIFILYTRVDQIMLGMLSGVDSVGVYSLAVKLSEGFALLPGIIATVTFPTVMMARESGLPRFKWLVSVILTISVVLSVLVIIFVYLFSDLFFGLFTEAEFAESSGVLKILIIGFIFYSMSLIVVRILVVEGLQRLSLYRGVVGLVVNVILNYLLIPIWGVKGAAVSTVVSQFSAMYFVNVFDHRSRWMFFAMSRSLLLLNILDVKQAIREVLKK
jgi:O-antigen/teichoic acid export membrane protein